MTAPRIPLFQRKGAPAPAKKPGIMIAISHENPGSNDGAGPGSVRGSADDGGAIDVHDVTCPACGAEFDAETGELKGDIGKGPQPDEQAPGGDALANLFGGAPGAPKPGA